MKAVQTLGGHIPWKRKCKASKRSKRGYALPNGSSTLFALSHCFSIPVQSKRNDTNEESE